MSGRFVVLRKMGFGGVGRDICPSKRDDSLEVLIGITFGLELGVCRGIEDGFEHTEELSGSLPATTSVSFNPQLEDRAGEINFRLSDSSRKVARESKEVSPWKKSSGEEVVTIARLIDSAYVVYQLIALSSLPLASFKSASDFLKIWRVDAVSIALSTPEGKVASH